MYSIMLNQTRTPNITLSKTLLSKLHPPPPIPLSPSTSTSHSSRLLFLSIRLPLIRPIVAIRARVIAIASILPSWRRGRLGWWCWSFDRWRWSLSGWCGRLSGWCWSLSGWCWGFGWWRWSLDRRCRCSRVVVVVGVYGGVVAVVAIVALGSGSGEDGGGCEGQEGEGELHGWGCVGVG
ncbi:hypothetical protein BDV95DRAFT_583110 [Massariosphaeria phaeospora]|uniref:Uncharacterized protein n=1 Tax=Massariosphaeria phaeospora TaxID=100035 RepID=A0A7C8I8B9_9PLEO|nr:hypothetical protein BDV95DRAFT_583110 [Massariosphaeria phaeospora]